MAFAFSLILYPHRYRFALRLIFPEGAIRVYRVPLVRQSGLGYFCPTPRKGKNWSSPNIRDARGKIASRKWLNLAVSGANRAPLAMKSFVSISQKGGKAKENPRFYATTA